MNNSQRRRALLPLYLQTRRILILHVTRVLMYTSTVTAKEFIDIDFSALDETPTATCEPSEIATWERLKFRRGT